jgi:hypothetical protein
VRSHDRRGDSRHDEGQQNRRSEYQEKEERRHCVNVSAARPHRPMPTLAGVRTHPSSTRGGFRAGRSRRRPSGPLPGHLPMCLGQKFRQRMEPIRRKPKPEDGFEPTTPCLQGRGSRRTSAARGCQSRMAA